jgi:hypothetical protein
MEGVSVVVAAESAVVVGMEDVSSGIVGYVEGVTLSDGGVEVPSGDELTSGLVPDEELSAGADSGGVSDVDVDAPSTSGVDVELTKGGAWDM